MNNILSFTVYKSQFIYSLAPWDYLFYPTTEQKNLKSLKHCNLRIKTKKRKIKQYLAVNVAMLKIIKKNKCEFLVNKNEYKFKVIFDSNYHLKGILYI